MTLLSGGVRCGSHVYVMSLCRRMLRRMTENLVPGLLVRPPAKVTLYENHLTRFQTERNRRRHRGTPEGSDVASAPLRGWGDKLRP